MRFVGTAAMILCLSFSIFAQASINGALGGRVTDVNDSAVGGADVVLTNVETNRTISAVSDDAGTERRIDVDFYVARKCAF
ncbi:MAG TPA: carboxypeptidase-like regulatory domain-containing protein [Pyrinomonadaceae bacterium]|nr:carboxypeptidase-like regulatory domain-containing protein [Pyrinomonadaceae bacterium]